MTKAEIAGWVLGFIAVAYLVIRECIKSPSPGDGDHASPKERQEAIKRRAEAMKQRQKTIREQMEQRGIKSLLGGRPGWRKVVVMSEPPKAAKVTPIRRRAT